MTHRCLHRISRKASRGFLQTHPIVSRSPPSLHSEEMGTCNAGWNPYLSSSLTVTCCRICMACLWYSSWAWTSADSWLTCSICGPRAGKHALMTMSLSSGSYCWPTLTTEQPLIHAPGLSDACGQVESQAQTHSFLGSKLMTGKKAPLCRETPAARGGARVSERSRRPCTSHRIGS